MTIRLDEYRNLLNDFEKASEREKWNIPFPMAVFGTLRKNQGNNYLMGKGPGGNDGYAPWDRGYRQDDRTERPEHVEHRRAFLPHYTASGIHLDSDKGGCAPCEVFFYTPEEWAKMIIRVDRLEGFSPSRTFSRESWGYHRTLANLRLVPEPCDNRSINHAFAVGISPKRCCGVPMEEWEQYEAMPCWVYAGCQENMAVRKFPNSPIIWDGLATK